MPNPSPRNIDSIRRNEQDSISLRRESARSAGPVSTRWLFAGLGAAALLTGYWYFNHKKDEAQQPVDTLAISVRVVPVTHGNMPVVERTIGTVVSDAMVQVTAMVPGRLQHAYFREGQMVRKGDLLFQIDPRTYQAALAQAKGQLAKDKALLIGAQRTLKRDERLMAAGAGTQQLLDDQRATAASYEGAVEADQANVDTAAINLDYTQIRSPITGKTGPILIQPGNVIAVTGTSASTTPLVTISQVTPIKISFSLPQADLSRVQAARRNHPLMATIRTRNGDERYSAPVTFTGNAINNQTGTIELRVTLDNKNGTLVPGQVVNVSVTLNEIPDALIVSHEGVNEGPAGHYVFVIRDGKAEMRPVKLLFDDSRRAAVKGPLKLGEQVVIDGQLRLVAGTPVIIDHSQDGSDALAGGAISAVPQ
jgi:membrane fusion protein, multidrug efflux system